VPHPEASCTAQGTQQLQCSAVQHHKSHYRPISGDTHTPLTLAATLAPAAAAGEFSTFYFGQNHPMKPHRLTMTHQLVLGYDLQQHMDVFVSTFACSR
jgi:acetoin utilization deacetylase AcuC-like enzyme